MKMSMRKINLKRNLALAKIDTGIPVKDVTRFTQASYQTGCF